MHHLAQWLKWHPFVHWSAGCRYGSLTLRLPLMPGCVWRWADRTVDARRGF